jgi:TonB family protein
VLESGSATGSELIGAAKRELQQQEIEKQVGGFLALAMARIGSGALLEPAQDNARFYIESARALAPQDAGLPPAVASLRAAISAAAGTAVGAGDLAAAERWIAAGEESGMARAELADLRRALQSARITQQAASLAALGRQFNDRLRQNRLLDPVADSARALYLRMRDTDAQSPATIEARDALGREMIAESRIALARADLEGSERWVAEAEAIGFSATETTNAKRDIATQRAREDRANEVAPVSRLALLRMVEPEYPAEAQSRGQAGWVDLEFTLTTRGTVGEVRVIDASPAGVFDKAATEALARWRFKPVERDGVAVTQRAKLRIRFDLK